MELKSQQVEEPLEQANNICTLTANILRKSKTPAQNLSRSERYALKQLQQDTDIIILPADKEGNTTVIMDKKDYDTKIQELFTDDVYQKLKKDPTSSLKNQTT